jgi:putative nucleotidyltransferase with HDIG domain
MIREIAIEQLRVGMYVYDLNLAWQSHPFAWQCFLIEDAEMLRKIVDSGIARLEIDNELGVDVGVTDAKQEPEVQNELSSAGPTIIAKLSPAEQFDFARNLYANANRLMQGIMQEVRMGKPVDLAQCQPLVDNILDSMFRFPSTLLPLAQMKTRDEYTFQHSVSVAALSVSFGRVLELPRREIKEVALGGLLHDIGKATVPGKILNKPGKLDDAEFTIMKNHVVRSAELIRAMDGISEIALNVAAQHHERFDGTGYPQGLKGEQISLHGQMIGIVDVYDAITSLRVYHKPMPPTEALQKMYEWSGAHFDPKLVQAFIKGIGIYPAGSLVRMDSDKLGIVREVLPEKILQPIVQLIYDCKRLCNIPPELVDLSASDDRIKSHESFEAWGIDQMRWAEAGA